MALVAALTFALLSYMPEREATPPPPGKEQKQLSLTLLRTIPHDSAAFTQGLVYLEKEGYLLESTGLYGESDLRAVNATNGDVFHRHKLDKALFGEGLTHLPETQELFQLTWREHALLTYRYDASQDVEGVHKVSFTPKEVWKSGRDYPPTVNGQLWGICNNVTHFFVSDGTPAVYVWERLPRPKLVGRMEVHREVKGKGGRLKRKTVTYINELECLPGRGEILANVWYSHDILRIDSESGRVLQTLDMTAIAAPQHPNVLNGIAYDATRSDLYVTGKNWDKMYVYHMATAQQGRRVP
eukprot:TRINITY_DN65557_c0_g1_i1.p1 TRINITY_DN65557_c0_g1~~TRINITY_DN65557_c0_g1_i1.p1  ORF type:complete len:324 (+),score=108.09 TRINITY_DN65557_c0_g1_i1:79-972(+)